MLLIGRKAICNWLGVSWQTVRRWKHQHGFPLIQRRGMRPMLHKDLVRTWFATVYGEEAAKHILVDIHDTSVIPL
jgi:phage terminase Nu1 subunit (DNA packaging protein)